MLMERFAPPGVVVDGHLQIVHFQGETGKYLQPPAGRRQLERAQDGRDGIVLRLANGGSATRERRGRPARRKVCNSAAMDTKSR